MRIALAQINCTVGDLAGNAKKIADFIARAKNEKADLIVFPELAITGYPPEDLLLKPQFIADNLAALKEVVRRCAGIAAYVGFVDRQGKKLFNAAAFIVDQKIKTVYRKINLPNYGVFDEKRYFTEGKRIAVVSFKGIKIGLGICEDIWVEKGPGLKEARAGAKLILNINASPYYVGKVKVREKILKTRARAGKTGLVYVNLVGGQDELVFDGRSMVFNPRGKLIAAARQYREDLLVFDLDQGGEISPQLAETAEVYESLLLGVKDYVKKNSFKEVVVGLSGGIDSALTLAIAADALGPAAVHALFMPAEFTSEQSCRDALAVARNLGVELIELPIKTFYENFLAELRPHFKGKPADITEENLQARIRGKILMAFSNKFAWLVLTTGNKSEMSVGYCTLYGDMVGGFGVLKDVPKTLVYQLANWRNQKAQVIPESVLTRAPTAELRPDQTDQDTLPPYEVLDPIIKAYVEENRSIKQIKKMGFSESVVRKVVAMIDRAEYKRRQAPPGPRISPRAFGKDWRLPITNLYAN